MSQGIKHDFRCGDRVFDPSDPRHAGQIAGIDNGNTATVVWDRNGQHSGFVSFEPLRNLRKIGEK